ncbi:MAG: CotH kinase family protein, partial [Tepidisphaerales bacterium]
MIRYACILALAFFLCAAAPATRPATQPVRQAEELFSSPASLYTVRVSLPAAAWKMMQPTQGTVPKLPKASRSTTQPYVEGERLPSGPAGNEYAYVRATVGFEHAGQTTTLGDVAIRLKGNASYNTSTGVRRPFKLNFHRFSPGRRFLGQATLNLHNNSMDPDQIRESLAYSVLRDTGLPASRTASALVYITIDGVVKDEYLGYYDMVEEIDSRFLKKHFGSSAGLLLKPEGFRGLPFFGEDWASYELRY